VCFRNISFGKHNVVGLQSTDDNLVFLKVQLAWGLLLVCVLQETYQLCVSLPFRFYHVENACILL
jgi:hypothetical protein